MLWFFLSQIIHMFNEGKMKLVYVDVIHVAMMTYLNAKYKTTFISLKYTVEYIPDIMHNIGGSVLLIINLEKV